MQRLEKTITGNRCFFDAADIAVISTGGLSVCTKPDGYKTLVFSSGPHKSRYYCRILLNAKHGEEVDHIDGNILNNCKENLRLVTSSQNKWNQQKRGKSELPKGVALHGTSYRATITKNYIRHYIGTYPTVEEAEQAYKKKADELHGKYAYHNSRTE